MKFSILSGKVTEIDEIPEDQIPDLLEEIIYALNNIFGEDAELSNGVNLVFPSEGDSEIGLAYGEGQMIMATFDKADIPGTIGLTE